MSGGTVYSDLFALMTRYLSIASVEATLGTVLEKRKLTAAELTPDDLAEVVADAMVGLRAFCRPEQLPELMLELADFCDEQEQVWSRESGERRTTRH